MDRENSSRKWLRRSRTSSGLLAEGRQVDGDDLQPVVEVLAEAAPLDLVVEVLVRGADEADVDGARARLADPADLLLLEDAEELGLEGERQVADLVEEERAARGLLDEPDFVPDGAR